MLRLVRDARLTPQTEPVSFPFPTKSNIHNPELSSPVGNKALSTSIMLNFGRISSDQPRIGFSTSEILSSINSMSRRMDDLARQLNCFGHFKDDDDDSPRAA